MTIDVLDKSKVIGHIDTRVEITVQDIDDIMCAALEGGITYWCCEAYPYGYRDGKMHNGIDIALHTGDTVVSAFRGMVRVAKRYGSFGNVVVIRHYNGFETVYAHLSKIDVQPGDMVDPGQYIGKGGNTGRSRGAHLHFEIRFKGNAVNPRYIVDLDKKKILSDAVVVKKTNTGFVAYPVGTIFHTVRGGDYLYKVALQYGITVKQLCAWNGIGKKANLVAGRKLKVSQ